MKGFSSQVQLDEENISKLENGNNKNNHNKIQKNKKMKTTNGNTTNGKYMNKHVYMESEKKEKIKIFKEII